MSIVTRICTTFEGCIDSLLSSSFNTAKVVITEASLDVFNNFSISNPTIGRVNVLYNVDVILLESFSDFKDFVQAISETKDSDLILMYNIFDDLTMSGEELNFVFHRLFVSVHASKLNVIFYIHNSLWTRFLPNINTPEEQKDVSIGMIVYKWAEEEN